MGGARTSRNVRSLMFPRWPILGLTPRPGPDGHGAPFQASHPTTPPAGTSRKGAASPCTVSCWESVSRSRRACGSYSYTRTPPSRHAAEFLDGHRHGRVKAPPIVGARATTAVKVRSRGGHRRIRFGHTCRRGTFAVGGLLTARSGRRWADRADLLFGTHGQFSVAGRAAHGTGHRPLSTPCGSEEPVPPDDPAAMARSRARPARFWGPPVGPPRASG